jgi:RNA polymerase subunit RPABC4/transcription elongation factor Spt4
MPGYKHPCRYCEQLIPSEANICPFCGKVNPLGPLRCPKCRSPIEKGYVACSNCGLSLKIVCPKCGKKTFFGDYCEHCEAPLIVVCLKCKTEQPPVGKKCVKCGKPLKLKGGD